jgi:radical SAM superfamily enzyme YgiQ (UPF0313 family)
MKTTICTLHVRRSPQSVALAAGCLAAALPERLRSGCTLLDGFPDQTDDEILSAVLAGEPDVVAFPVYLWNRVRAVRLAQELRRTRPHTYLIAGGPEATGDPQGLLATNVWSALVCGEGESPFAGLLKAFEGGDRQPQLAGVILAGAESSPCEEPSPPKLTAAASPWLSGTLKPQTAGGVLWEVSRGCAFCCDYCFEARGRNVRYVDRERLKQELKLFTAAGISQLWVLDSTFNYPPERGAELLELLLAEAPELHYHLEAKADFIDRRTAQLLARLNCSVQLGLQSLDQNVLQNVHRPLDRELLSKALHLLDAEGIIYGFDLIYGLPGDNYAGFRDSLDAALSFSPNHVHIFPLAVLPGTRLHRRRQRHGIEAQSDPPYLLISSDDWSTEELELCRRLAAAVDLFYNTGRAVAFMPTFIEALQQKPSVLFEEFFSWALQQEGTSLAGLLDTESWSAADAYRLTRGFVSERLQQAGQGHLTSAFFDLLSYHFHYAETLLGRELQALQRTPPLCTLWSTPWQRAEDLRLVPFSYEILTLLEMEGMELAEFAELFRPVGSVALFLRRNDAVLCESLSEEMLQLLEQSDGTRTPEEIFAGCVPRETGEELVHFAVSEGLLKPAIGTAASAAGS